MISKIMTESLDVVSFMACGARFAIEAQWVKGQLLMTETAQTRYSFEYLIGLSNEIASTSTAQRVLLLKLATVTCAMTVSEPVELRCVSVDSVYPLPFFIAQRSQIKGLCGLAMTQEGLTLLVDLRELLQEQLLVEMN